MITAQEAIQLFEKDEKYNAELKYYKNYIDKGIKNRAKQGERKAEYKILGDYYSTIGYDIKNELSNNGFEVDSMDIAGECILTIRW